MLRPGAGSLQLGAFARPRDLGVTAEYLHRVSEGLSLYGTGLYSGREWRVEGGLRLDW